MRLARPQGLVDRVCSPERHGPKRGRPGRPPLDILIRPQGQGAWQARSAVRRGRAGAQRSQGCPRPPRRSRHAVTLRGTKPNNKKPTPLADEGHSAPGHRVETACVTISTPCRGRPPCRPILRCCRGKTPHQDRGPVPARPAIRSTEDQPRLVQRPWAIRSSM